jgi:hypothetical protein
MLKREEIHAIQVDLFDNRDQDESLRRSDLAIRLRLETPNTDGSWFEASGQITTGRKPSQTRRVITEELDKEAFEYMVELREQLQIENTIGWDFKPVITNFYPKGQKKAGKIPTFYAMVYKRPNKPWGMYIQLGEYSEHFKMEEKDSKTHKIYYIAERYVYRDTEQARKRYGF